MSYVSLSEPCWSRSRDGMIAGVCAGVARRFDMDAWVVRALWLAAVLAFGTGLVLYAIQAGMQGEALQMVGGGVVQWF